ncbi:response regulator [Macrococcus equipercicus]|uniref:Response regulator n=1 Tax=Macrococcus equipercicus TaxID=69967 RepID=A0A9Q9BUY1_9STAP|nr:response regulator [Macrococcus equipercicus]KAA1039271.1 response regulator [Macrococcus equipercicus]UTH13562.1 response regulator [Macrococcus equipercicus]
MVRILVIDDEDNIRLLLKEIFALYGLTMDEAENGRVGLDKLAAAHYDLVFMDKRMPVMSGFETLERLREVSDVPVYLISAYQTSEEMEAFISLGIEGILMKPFSIEEVAEIALKYR